NLMTRGNQTRHQLPADRPRRTCHENPHHRPLNRGIIYTPYDKTAAPEVTPASTPAREPAIRLYATGLRRRRAQARRGGPAARSPPWRGSAWTCFAPAPLGAMRWQEGAEQVGGLTVGGPAPAVARVGEGRVSARAGFSGPSPRCVWPAPRGTRPRR